jgi:hypothetical protein
MVTNKTEQKISGSAAKTLVAHENQKPRKLLPMNNVTFIVYAFETTHM